MGVFMFNKAVLVGVIFASCSFTLFAKDWSVEAIQTNGNGQLSVCSNFLLFSSCTKKMVKIPKYIKAGKKITIITEDREEISFSFSYIDYVPNKALCRLRPSGISGEDIVYINNCRPVK